MTTAHVILTVPALTLLAAEEVDVNGHTDSDGSDEYNDDLSSRRANSVAHYLVSQQLDSQRFSVQGFGESQPVASNASVSGKAQNRRVEIQIVPLT